MSKHSCHTPHFDFSGCKSEWAFKNYPEEADRMKAPLIQMIEHPILYRLKCLWSGIKYKWAGH